MGPHLAREFGLAGAADRTARHGFRLRSRPRPVRLHSRAGDAAAPLPRRGAQLLAVTDARPVHSRADLRLRPRPTGRARGRSSPWPGCGRSFTGFRRNRRFFWRVPPRKPLHETGHLFGLVHCADRACAMSLSTSVRQIDSKAAHSAPPCAARVRRLTAARPKPGPRDPIHFPGCPMKTHWQILVVDDEEVMCESLAAWLREDGYTVDTAASGRRGRGKGARSAITPSTSWISRCPAAWTASRP